MDRESQVWPMPVAIKNQMKVPQSTCTITELFNASESFLSVLCVHKASEAVNVTGVQEIPGVYETRCPHEPYEFLIYMCLSPQVLLQ